MLLGACVTIDRVSTSSGGTNVNADTTAVVSSDSGRYVAFQTAATDVVSDVTNGQPHVYRKDRITGAVVLTVNAFRLQPPASAATRAKSGSDVYGLAVCMASVEGERIL